MLVHKRLGAAVPVDWTEPRILCVADAFAPYDLSAVAHLGRSVQLAAFKLFEGGVLLMNVLGEGRPVGTTRRSIYPPPIASHSVEEHLSRAK